MTVVVVDKISDRRTNFGSQRTLFYLASVVVNSESDRS